jgi:ribonuclease Z
VAYKVTYKGRSLVLSGDTVKSAAIVREAANVDLLLHEALSTRMTRELAAAAGSVNRPNLKKVFFDIEDYHTTPEQAAEVRVILTIYLTVLFSISSEAPRPHHSM